MNHRGLALWTRADGTKVPVRDMSGYHIHNALRKLRRHVQDFATRVCSEEANPLFGADSREFHLTAESMNQYVQLRKELERRRLGRRSRLPRFGKPIPDNKHHVGEMILAAQKKKKKKKKKKKP